MKLASQHLKILVSLFLVFGSWSPSLAMDDGIEEQPRKIRKIIHIPQKPSDQTKSRTKDDIHDIRSILDRGFYGIGKHAPNVASAYVLITARGSNNKAYSFPPFELENYYISGKEKGEGIDKKALQKYKIGYVSGYHTEAGPGILSTLKTKIPAFLHRACERLKEKYEEEEATITIEAHVYSSYHICPDCTQLANTFHKEMEDTLNAEVNPDLIKNVSRWMISKKERTKPTLINLTTIMGTPKKEDELVLYPTHLKEDQNISLLPNNHKPFFLPKPPIKGKK